MACSRRSATPACLGLPYPEEFGGGGQPYEVYLQVLEELGSRWAAVAVGDQRARARVPPGRFTAPSEREHEWLPRCSPGG